MCFSGHLSSCLSLSRSIFCVVCFFVNSRERQAQAQVQAQAQAQIQTQTQTNLLLTLPLDNSVKAKVTAKNVKRAAYGQVNSC